MQPEILTEREHRVLEAIIHNFVLSAAPTSSRYISKLKGFDLSPASIRNVMFDLEERGFITQPHTSAGRIPTDKGYRYFVDRLMKYTDLPSDIKDQIRSTLVTADQADLYLLLEAASSALGRVTNQLGVILAPKLCNGKLGQLYVFPIEPQRFLLTIALESGFVKNMVIEFHTQLPVECLECACRILTTKFKGKTIQQMCDADETNFRDVGDLELGVVRLLVPSIKKLFETGEKSQVFLEGKTNVLLQPEFFSKDRIGAVIEILEEKKLLMHLFDTSHDKTGIVITIGGENQKGQLQSFSIIKTNYNIGGMVGSLGVIGPKRMPYPYLISVVEYTAKVIGELHS
ncbi:MAG: heat-inducible transcription repressor HrcA [Fibrobacter sp.]|nr:heat-inducible transcription repressor HrcA [Fibrobacter sp.]